MNKKMEEKDLLQFAVAQGIINLDDVRISMENKQRADILSKHKYSISQGTDGRWRTTLPDKTKKNGRRLVAKATKKALEDAVIAFYKEQDEPEVKHDLTLTDVYPDWIMYRSKLTKASSTIKRYKSVWNTWFAEKPVSGLPVSQLSYLYLNEWANTIVKNNDLTPKAYWLISSLMMQIMDYSVERGYIFSNPFGRVKVSEKMFRYEKKPESETQVFLEDEQELIAKAAREKFQMRPWCVTPLFVLLNFQLGLRIGELVALKWEDIDGDYLNIQRMETTTFRVEEDGNVVPDGYKIVPYLKSKSGSRQVYLNHIAKELISDIRKISLKNGYQDDGFMFIASRSKKRGTSRTLTKYLESLCKYANVNNKSNHKIRKTFISTLIEKKINIDTVREQAGHSSEKTTLRSYCFDTNVKKVKENALESAANTKMAL